MIEEIVRALMATGVEVQNLPPVRASLEEDGSVLIEWMTQDFRLGFNIEPNPTDSGWYVVTSKRIGETGAHGFLSSTDKANLISLILRFIGSNP
jgi:hypothetical protein